MINDVKYTLVSYYLDLPLYLRPLIPRFHRFVPMILIRLSLKLLFSFLPPASIFLLHLDLRS
jgi:hypothetical protein